MFGKRVSPYYPGHDPRGSRNERALANADILAIGDPLTYGFAAPRFLAQAARGPVGPEL